MTHTCYDAAFPTPGGIPGTDTVLIYCGGDAFHDWSASDIASQPERYRLPCWVRSNSGVNPNTDSAAMIQWLKSNNVPVNTATVLDLETLVDAAYVTQYGAALHAADYFVLPYGSSSTLFQNPELDGYFVAEPGATAIDIRCVATQYGYYQSYDLSWIADSVHLWDTQPPPPAPAPWKPTSGIVKPLTGKVGTLNAPVVAVVPTHTNKGYTLVGADGGTFNYGDAPFLGSLAGKTLNAPIVDAVRTSDGKGLVMVSTDGGVFCFGTAVFEGAEGGKPLNAPVVGIALTTTNKGYWLTAADGGIFAFGDAAYEGSAV